MATLLINGKKEKIPPFPHHKEYIYRCKKYFFARTLLDTLLLGRLIAIRETWRSIRHKAFIPRDLLLDPTSSCNLHCTGCWAADYETGSDIPLAKLDDIVNQAEALGIMDCIMSGGEPLLRKDDILWLCRNHRRTTFGAFTNGTLVDAAFADEVAAVQNLNLFLSIEGWREETDFRRGAGTFDQVIAAMDLLRERGIAFAFSLCYHAKNYLTIASDEFLDFLREKGCWFGWLFQYVPVGSGADLSLVCSPQQREYVMARIDAYSKKHQMVLIDFWNNGHLSFGCCAAGSGYVHINAKGDVEPCAFCHYADANIYTDSLADALRSPFFKKFRRSQPFSANPLSGCPLVSHPDKLADIVRESGAHSTHLNHQEPVEELASKTRLAAADWQLTAERLYAGFKPAKKRNFRIMLWYLRFKKRQIDR